MITYQPFIEAIDNLIRTRVGQAGYTQIITAVVQGVINSENKTYKVSIDSGKTCFTAQALVTSTDSPVAYENGDAVKLLQLNGTNNTDENIFILGKSSDLTETDLEDIKNYFIKGYSKIFTVADKYICEETTDKELFADIKRKKAFGFKAEIKTPSGVSNKNYGFKIYFQKVTEDNTVNLIVYSLDINNMLGQPFKFSDFVEQKMEKVIDDETVIKECSQIVIEPFGGGANTSDWHRAAEIYSATWTETDDYKVTFKDSSKIDYITDKENGKTTFELKAILLKNGVTFATDTCKYLWYKKTTDDVYSVYGGYGWQLLNEIKNVTYLTNDGGTETEEVIQNNIGDQLTINKSLASEYHNYFKCIVLYGSRQVSSEEKHILNINTTDTNLELYLENGGDTYTQEGYTLCCNFTKAEEKSYSLKIEKYSGVEGSEPLNIYTTDITTLPIKILGEYDENYDKYIYKAKLFSDNVLLEEIEKRIYYSGDTQIETVVQYHDNGTSSIMPENLEDPSIEWVDALPADWQTKYIIARKRMYGPSLQNEPWEHYWYSVNGSQQAAAQLEEFNKLTKNGRERGLYYGKGYVQTEDINKEEGKTYYIYDKEQNKYVEFVGEDFKTGIIYYEYEENALFFNADYINTGTIRVGNPEQEKFYASILNDSVKIGGFTVDNKSLISTDGAIGFSQNTNDWVLWTGAKNQDQKTAPFRVSTAGALYSTSGEIGGFTIENNSIYHSQNGGGTIGLFSKNTGSSDIAIYVTPNAGITDGFYVDYNGNVYCKKMFSVGTKDKGFSIDENGKVNWTANNTPIKYIYCSTAVIVPEDKSYDDFDSNNTNYWHKIYNEGSDHWYAVSTSGEAGSFNGPLRLDGQDGVPGKDGAQGDDGLSAYQVAKKNGYTGTEEEWLASLKGEKGSFQTFYREGAEEGSYGDLTVEDFSKYGSGAYYGNFGGYSGCFFVMTPSTKIE